MKNKFLQLILALITCWPAGFAQNILLTFTAGNNGVTLQPDSILIRNTSQNDEVMLYTPENELILVITSLEETDRNQGSSIGISEVVPNPVVNKSAVNIQIPYYGLVEVTVSDMLGRENARYSDFLPAGNHQFLFTPGKSQVYCLALRFHDFYVAEKIISAQHGQHHEMALFYNGFEGFEGHTKTTGMYTELAFQPGDELLMVAYSGGEESGIADSPAGSHEYYFDFAHNKGCFGLDSLLYEGQWYHTIQVWGQCLLKENLNVGVKIQGSQIQSDNGIVEKYCYGNSDNNCNTYGALYLWEETMQYSTEPRSRGICPEGWHIPADAELGVLEGAADSYFSIAHPVWQNTGTRGYDNGKHLKSTTGWMQNGNGLDTYFFNIISTGYWFDGGFSDLGENAIYYSSTTLGGLPVFHGFSFGSNQSMRNTNNYQVGLPVRCIKNN